MNDRLKVPLTLPGDSKAKEMLTKQRIRKRLRTNKGITIKRKFKRIHLYSYNECEACFGFKQVLIINT
jgi:hypothetical protein